MQPNSFIEQNLGGMESPIEDRIRTLKIANVFANQVLGKYQDDGQVVRVNDQPVGIQEELRLTEELHEARMSRLHDGVIAQEANQLAKKVELEASQREANALAEVFRIHEQMHAATELVKQQLAGNSNIYSLDAQRSEHSPGMSGTHYDGSKKEYLTPVEDLYAA